MPRRGFARCSPTFFVPVPAGSTRHMIPPPTEETIAALGRIPAAQFLITTAYGEVRDGRLVERVQQCGTAPPMLLVAMEKGHPLSPLIRDSRTFAISLLDPAERLLQRVFGPDRRIGEDPFLTYPHTVGMMGAPIVTRAVAWFDCEVVRHLDMETNFELYVGLVHRAGAGDAPAQRLNAALTAARRGEPRVVRPRASIDRAPAAESPTERGRSVGASKQRLPKPH
jgi:flavin reductase (DIM6/NTAB) family NADH-FMN oxidoreductase RutF